MLSICRFFWGGEGGYSNYKKYPEILLAILSCSSKRAESRENAKARYHVTLRNITRAGKIYFITCVVKIFMYYRC